MSSAFGEPAPAGSSPAAASLPFHIRALDALALVATLLAITVAITGGFREWTPIGRLSITTWLRPAFVALAAIGLRTYLWPQQPLPRHLADVAARWWRDEAMRVSLPVFLTTRVGVLIIGFLAVILLGYGSPEGPPWRVYKNEFLNLPARFDAGWYLGIAARGYEWNPRAPEGQQNIVFFPAFPLLVRYGALLLARQALWAGVLLSLASFLGALVYVYKLAREWLARDEAAAAIAFLAAYPFAVFYSAAYTESLFLLATAGACYHFRRDQLWQAGAWGLIAGFTRPNGCLLSIVLGLMLIDRLRREWPGSWRDWPWGRQADRLAIAAIPGLALIAYCAFIYSLTGDPFQWSKQQIGWGRSYRGIDALVTDRIDFIADRGFYDYASTQTMDMLYAVAVLMMLFSVWPILRRFGLPLATLVLVNLLPPLATGGLLSMGRMTSVLFPFFLWLGAVVPAGQRQNLLVAFAMLQALAAAMFFTWRPMF